MKTDKLHEQKVHDRAVGLAPPDEAFAKLQAQRDGRAEQQRTSPTTDTVKVPALAGDDGIAALADRADPRIGSVIKFDKVGYTAADGTAVAGTRFVVMGSAEEKIIFIDGRVAKRWTRRPGVELPTDDDVLDEFDVSDPAKWPKAANGDPMLPVIHTVYLHLARVADGTLYSFGAKSWSGKKSLERLGGVILQQRAVAPGARPIISLEVGQVPDPSLRLHSVPAI